jgi:carbon monoxide dehydrogenase subunit G
MASIHQDVVIDVPPDMAWDALADLGALHTRLVRGFVVDCHLDGNARDVTFANGLKARERIVDVDPVRRRVAWSATGDRLSHHNASAQVLDEPDGCTRVVWVADLLPNEMAPAIAGLIAQGLSAMKGTLEADLPR